MDINTTADVKGYNTIATPPSVELEGREKPPVAPVQSGSESESGKLDQKTLRNREEEQDGEKFDLTRENARQLAEDVQQRFDFLATRLDLIVDDQTGTLVAKILERDSGKLIRQVPTDQLLNLRAKLNELVGMLFDDFA